MLEEIVSAATEVAEGSEAAETVEAAGGALEQGAEQSALCRPGREELPKPIDGDIIKNGPPERINQRPGKEELPGPEILGKRPGREELPGPVGGGIEKGPQLELPSKRPGREELPMPEPPAEKLQKPDIPDPKSGKKELPQMETAAKTTDVGFKTMLPRTEGKWSGEAGDSNWYPNPESIPPDKNGTNPEHKTWGEILKEYNIDNIPYKDGYPDFSEICKGQVEIDDFSDNRGRNFTQADEKMAEQRGCTPQEVKKWREEHGYTWHECQDCRTMQKVPTEVHGNVPHSGGVSVYKAQHKNT